PSPTFSGTVAGANTVPLGIVAQIGANTVLGNATAGTANIVAQSMPSCSTAGSALKWTTSTGFGCNSAITAATNANLTGPITSVGNATSIAAQTGTGSTFVVNTNPIIAGLTVTGSFTATGLVGNASLANPSTTVNGTTCTLGSTCTPTPNLAGITNSLGSNAALNNSTFTDGPSVAQGSTGTWFVSGNVLVEDTGVGGGGIACKLWDGTAVIDSTDINIPQNFPTNVALSG